ncbi:hypothetical protein SG34_023970 [Thalassomonas viridans]|uniref:Porin n=1 Tax=Thalassomonas viridans TaxID=137584 RepID=A0AAF0C8Z2_9GAMM|nr:hypothetical protein [Thalassomonas viridans]WDE04364.1 hypothetical protein SG34_023970 [Thalassomonas viridans]
MANVRKVLVQIGLCIVFLQPYKIFGFEQPQAATAAATKNSEIQLGLTSSFQGTNKAGVSSEALYSLDLELEHHFDDFGLFLWLEHSSDPKVNGVSVNFENANSDAGTTSGKVRDGRTTGRSQFSAFYLFGDADALGEPGWQLGLMEVSTLIDSSQVANDETSQFLSAGLVNNGTIAFPDYALSGRLQNLNAFDNLGYRLVLSSAAGIAENDGNYADLFSLKPGSKGVFAAAELVHSGYSHQAGLGYWKNSADDVQAYGVYLSLDYLSAYGDINMRYGQASSLLDSALEPDAAWPSQFFSLSFETKINTGALNPGVLGYGMSFTRFDGAHQDINREWEVYYRLPLYKNIYLTPSIQRRNLVAEDKASQNYWLPTIRLEMYL